MQRKSSRATTKSTLFAVSKDERNTMEDTGMPIKNALYILPKTVYEIAMKMTMKYP